MHPDRFVARREKLLHRVSAEEVEALLVTNVTNVSYLTGFSGDSSFLLLGPRHELLITDGRYTTQLAEECPGLALHVRTPQTKMLDATAAVLNDAKVARMGFESGSVTVELYEQLREKVKPLELVGKSGLVEELRQVKDNDEVAEIREAIRQAERGFAAAVPAWIGEMTELQAAHELEHLMRRFGARRAAFDPIVASGPRAALPHARASEARLDTSPFVLVDWGATTARGYRSDLTRVVATGNIPPKVEEVYRVVLKANVAARQAVRPGMKGAELDAVARRVIVEAGYASYFNHSLGHGIGLDIHEGPRLSAAFDDELRPGMVVTIEPGIYIPGEVGVRIEDDVLITPDGCELLTSTPREFEECFP